MDLYNIVEKIKETALLQPNIRTAEEGSIYTIMNANPSIKYGAVVITQNTHKDKENLWEYSFSIFCVDRLTPEKDNRLQIQSTAIKVLKNILNFIEDDNIICLSNDYHTFTERFVDDVAGCYVNVVFQVPNNQICEEEY